MAAYPRGPRLSRPSYVSSVFLVLFLICSECAGLTYANVSSEICGADGHNIQNLTKAWYWYYESTNEEVCALTNSPSCHFNFAVCKSLPFPFECDNCSVAVNSTADNTYNIGAYDKTMNPITSVASESTFAIYYTSWNISSILLFSCDSSAKWITESGNKASRVPDSAHTIIQRNSSSYTFKFLSAEACVPPVPPKGGGLSTGSILLLIFFPTLALYFILGTILNKMGGAHGKELVPNYEFWNSLPGLIADGVVFTWSMITCQGSKGVAGYDSI